MIISLWGASCHGALVRGDFCPVPIITPKKIRLNTMKKRKGDKCTSCRTPTLVRKKSEYSSPLKTRDFTLLYIFTIVLYILHV
jgi:Zn-finger protein